MIEELILALERNRVTPSDLLRLSIACDTPFRRHPLGFLCCHLYTEDKRSARVHLWPVEMANKQSLEFNIHDHVFSFTSWVLVGEVMNVCYAPSPAGDRYAEYKTVYCGADVSTLSKESGTAKLKETSRERYSAGSRYELRAGVLHETFRTSSQSALTVLVTGVSSMPAARVYGPIDGQIAYSYHREIVDKEEVGRLVEELRAPVSVTRPG
jgi:hypothetical protein